MDLTDKNNTRNESQELNCAGYLFEHEYTEEELAAAELTKSDDNGEEVFFTHYLVLGMFKRLNIQFCISKIMYPSCTSFITLF